MQARARHVFVSPANAYSNCGRAVESNCHVFLWGSANESFEGFKVPDASTIYCPIPGISATTADGSPNPLPDFGSFRRSDFKTEVTVPRLGVNVDHIATLRQARGGSDPDPIAATVLVELAGADGIVVHLREDRRHIQDRDVRLLRDMIHTKLDLEIAADEEMAKIALGIRPDMVTLVPERRQELTTEGGLDAVGHKDRLHQIVDLLHNGGISVSLFIEPDLSQVKAAHKLSADFIELHTGRYANAQRAKEADAAVEAITQSAKLAYKLGLGVNAGHGLNYQNVKRLTHVPEIVEYNIGHSIMARAMLVGLDRAVKEMKALIG